MADIKYLNYNDLQIEELALLNNLSNKVVGYVLNQPWSKNKKEKFMSAYQDIMSRGLKGASNSSGEWVINTGGEDPIFNSEKDREIYGEAAWFIQQEMSQLPTKVLLHKKEKTDIQDFDNTTFIRDFEKHLIGNEFGGMLNFSISSDWNTLDKRGDNGLLLNTERTKLFAKNLRSYADSIKDKYNFENSPFGSYENFRTKAYNAAAALESPDINDDEPNLRALGIRRQDWFNNGSGDPYTGDPNFTGTYGQYYNEYLPNKQKQELEAKALEESRLLLYGVKISGLSNRLVTRRELADKYKNINLLVALLGDYGDRLDNLKPQELDELLSAFLYGANLSISDDEWNILKSKQEFSESSRDRFKKHPGVDNLIYDTATKRVIQLYDKNNIEGNIDYLSGLSTKDLQQEYLNNPNDGFTDADIRELIAIGADLTAMFDPTRIYGTIAGVGASGLRTYNRFTDEDGPTLYDIGASALDLGLNGIQWLPGIGNIANGAKGILSLAKFAPKIGRLIARAGAAGGLVYGISGLPEVWNKIDFEHPIDSAKRLTVEDWRKLSALMAGIKGTRDLNVTNRASRKALLERGYEVSNRLDKRMGLTSSKPIGESTSSTVKLNIEGKGEVEIPISTETKKTLDEKLSKVGNDVEARSKIVRDNPEVQAAAERIASEKGFKVKEKVTDASGRVTEKISDDWNNAKITYDNSVLTSLRNARLFGSRVGLAPSWARTHGGMYGLTSNPVGRGYDNFNNYINSNRGLLDKFKYGSDRTLKRMDEFNSAYYGTTSVPNVLGILYSGELDDKTIKELNNAFNPPVKKTKKASKWIIPKNRSVKEKLIDGSEYQVLFGKNSSTGKDEMFLIINGNSNKVEGNSLGEMKKNLGKMIRNINMKIQSDLKLLLKIDDPKWISFVKSIEDLKRKGYLYLQGGRIDKLKIQIYKKHIGK